MRYSRYPLDPSWRPPARMMSEAPLVEDYELFLDVDDMHLRGILHGSPDPRFEDGARFVSGVIQAYDEEEGWAISYHGGYRLGAPLRPLPERKNGD